MAFDGTEGGKITLEQAAKWTANYRSNNPNLVKAHFYGATNILSILAQPGAVGIRIYHAIDDEGKIQVILVGTDKDENDLENGVLIEFGRHCPPRCGKANVLNGL